MKRGEFIDKDLGCIPKVITVLNYLNQGRELQLRDYIYRLAETDNGGFTLLFKMYKSTSSDMSNSEEEWFGFQGNLITFSTMCNELTEEELTLMLANMSLQEINFKKR